MRLTKSKGCLLGLVSAVLILGYILYEVFGVGKFPSVWNQKITVTVEGPLGPISASSVTEMKTVPTGSFTGDGRRSNTYLTGEAVVLDLGETSDRPRYLFALLRQYNRYRKVGDTTVFYANGETIDVPRKNYPLLVTFDDINDPASVKRVDPANLAASFGPGYSLKSITLEITDEPVTTGKVEEVLGWIYDPEVLKNPTWKNLPSLSRTAIRGLRQPGGSK